MAAPSTGAVREYADLRQRVVDLTCLLRAFRRSSDAADEGVTASQLSPQDNVKQKLLDALAFVAAINQSPESVAAVGMEVLGTTENPRTRFSVAMNGRVPSASVQNLNEVLKILQSEQTNPSQMLDRIFQAVLKAKRVCLRALLYEPRRSQPRLPLARMFEDIKPKLEHPDSIPYSTALRSTLSQAEEADNSKYDQTTFTTHMHVAKTAFDLLDSSCNTAVKQMKQDPSNIPPALTSFVLLCFEYRRNGALKFYLERVAGGSSLYKTIRKISKFRQQAFNLVHCGLSGLCSRLLQDTDVYPVPTTPQQSRTRTVQHGMTFRQALLSLYSAEELDVTWPGYLDDAKRQYQDVVKTNCYVHAEVELVFYYSTHAELSPSSLVGCSKHACLLCNMFFENHPYFRIRDTHGKIYPGWTVPPLIIARDKNHVNVVVDILRKMVLQIEREVKTCLSLDHLKQLRQNLRPDSTSGVSSTLQAVTEKDAPAAPQIDLETLSLEDPPDTRSFAQKQSTGKPSSDGSQSTDTTQAHGSDPSYTPQATDSPCTMCNAPNSKFCQRCRSSRYCSKECQRTDWPAHKLLCREYANQPSRPGPSYRRAIFFHPAAKSPRFLWIECEMQFDEDYGMAYSYESANIRDYMGPNYTTVQYKYIRRNTLRDRTSAESTIELVFRETFLVDGSQLNNSIIQACGGECPHSWKGPVIAMRKRGVAFDPRYYEDITMTDYRDTLDYFLEYLKETATEAELGRNQDKKGKIKGVRVNCKGDEMMFGADKYVAVDVPPNHRVFAMAGYQSPLASFHVPPISTLVELPVIVHHYKPDRLWDDSSAEDFEGSHPSVNQAITFLFRETDLESDWWGWARPAWRDDVGSVLIVRQDRKDITPQQVEALCHFCQYKLQPLFEDALGAGLVERTKEEVMSYITKSHFENFFWACRSVRLDDPRWNEAQSPYVN